MNSFYNFKKLILLGGDIVVLYTSLFLTLLLRYRELPSNALWTAHVSLFSAIFLFWLTIFYIANLYDLRLAVNNARFWQLSAESILIAGFLSIAFFYLIPNNSITPKTNLLIYIVVFGVLFFLWRQFYNWSLKAYLPKNYIAIIGLNNEVRELIDQLKIHHHLGYHIAFIINPGSPDETLDIKQVSSFALLPKLIIEHKISTIVLSEMSNQSEELRNILFSCLPLKVSYLKLTSFYEAITGKIPINVINQTWFLENLSEGGKGVFDTFKRVYDIILAIVSLFVSLIFWPLISLIIKLESHGPIFFIQTRVGKDGQPFQIYKFRTMAVADNDFSPTAIKDKRITKFGNFLRLSRLDELPQLINILKGEMSFVGPRPERPELIKDLEQIIPFYQERMLVKPGITGWDQVSGEYHSPSREDTLKKLQADLFYIKNRSIYLDLSIILKTIYTVLSRGGR